MGHTFSQVTMEGWYLSSSSLCNLPVYFLLVALLTGSSLTAASHSFPVKDGKNLCEGKPASICTDSLLLVSQPGKCPWWGPDPCPGTTTFIPDSSPACSPPFQDYFACKASLHLHHIAICSVLSRPSPSVLRQMVEEEKSNLFPCFFQQAHALQSRQMP